MNARDGLLGKSFKKIPSTFSLTVVQVVYVAVILQTLIPQDSLVASMQKVKGGRLHMSGSPSADEWQIVRGRSADNPPLVCRPNSSLTEINSFGLNFSSS
jgi:hypothetical protein